MNFGCTYKERVTMYFDQLPVYLKPVKIIRMFSYNTHNTCQEEMNEQNSQYFGDFAYWNNQQQHSSWSHNDANQLFVSTNNNQCNENYSQQISAPIEPTWFQIPVQTNNYAVSSSPTLEELLNDLNPPVQQREYINKPVFNHIARGRKHTRRHRTAFTTNQIEALESVFKKQIYVNNAERAGLSKMLGLTERAVRVWFQNRRMKEKRSEEYVTNESSTSNVSSSSDTVESLESEIKACDVINSQVCLTSKVYDKLGALLQTFLPNVNEKSHGPESSTINSASNGYTSYNTNNHSYVMLDNYDPISPANHNSSISF